LHIVAPRASHASGQFDLRLDCDLTNPLANGGCGPMAAATFGTGILTTRYDTDFLRGGVSGPNGVDISVNARLPRSIIVQGGFSTSHEVFDSCDVVAKVDNLRTFHMGRTRLQGQFNVYNLLNVGPILGVNTTYGANWLAPTATLVGRMFKFGAQVDW
jgi:hypothetical protein